MCGRGQILAPDARSVKKAWLRALNLAIGQMMDARDEALQRLGRPDDRAGETWEEVEEGMVQALAEGGGVRGLAAVSEGTKTRARRGDERPCDAADQVKIRAIAETTLAELGSAGGWSSRMKVDVVRHGGA